LLPSLLEHNDKNQAQVLIVCASREERAAKASLAGMIHSFAPREGSVRIIAIPDKLLRDATFVTARITEHLPSGTPHLLVPTQIALDTVTLSKSAFVLRPNGIRTLLRRDLPRLLEQLGLDWISRLDALLRNGWHHGSLDRNHINRWIQQFEHCGSHRWVAESFGREEMH
jgi:hypothetical protein